MQPTKQHDGLEQKGSQDFPGAKENHPQHFKFPARDLLHHFSAQHSQILLHRSSPGPQHHSSGGKSCLRHLGMQWEGSSEAPCSSARAV